jgi:CRP-like cAMP-binding protein
VAGIDLAMPQNQPEAVIGDQTSPKLTTGPERLLELVDIFASLTSDERKAIAGKLNAKSYDEGETLVEAGTVLHSLFIVGTGVLSLTREESEGEIELMRIGPGDHFGEIGMLTGAPAIAKVSAMIPATVYEVKKDDLSPILEARPEVSQGLCRALARRQATGQLASDELTQAVPVNRLTTWFSERLHRLYDIASAE